VGASPERATDLIFYILIAALFGSRVIHVFVNEWDRFLGNPLILFFLWEGGLVFYGGLIGAVLISLWYFKKHQLSFWTYTDIFIPAVALGHAIGRIGCFFAGCCHGRPVLQDVWYTVIFPSVEKSSAPPGIPLYPTQLMESSTEFLIFLFLFFWRRHKAFEGQLFCFYLMIYPIFRSILELFRGDLDRGFIVDPWLSTSQFISIFLFLTGLGLYIYRSGRKT